MSSNNLALSVRGLTKTYRITTGVERATTMGEAISARVRHPLRRRGHREQFRALQDVSFDVEPGELVGVIGRNGAGKSTLLKIMSRITDPEAGVIDVWGTLGSLLEVGTGFHPELTGRENIFLNGAILGMKRRQIARHFDAIVDFAGTEKFLDTPVKRYSSGMSVRLAFAVAAHLEPDIMLIDEVLAVGDAAFQRKCLGKMEEVSTQHGRTILFVSHNVTAVSRLCKRCLLIQGGRLVFDGPTEEAISLYIGDPGSGEQPESVGRFDIHNDGDGNGVRMLRRLSLLDGDGTAKDRIPMGGSVDVVIDVNDLTEHRGALVGFRVKSELEQTVFTLNSWMRTPSDVAPPSARQHVVFHIPELPLTPGRYWVTPYVKSHQRETLDQEERAGYFDVVHADVYGTGAKLTQGGGVLFVDHSWELRSGHHEANLPAELSVDH